jgi:hypothetical protein
MKRSRASTLLDRLIPLLVIILVCFGRAEAQSGGGSMSSSAVDNKVEWSVIANGGTIGATAGSRVLSGTVGQPITARVSSSMGVLYQGFWYPDMNSGPSSVDHNNIPVIAGLRTMLRNYPNPFSVSTIIRYRLASRSRVRLEVFDRLGASVNLLVDDSQGPGEQEFVWNGTDQKGDRAPSGAYIYRISVESVSGSSTEAFNEQQQMLIVR